MSYIHYIYVKVYYSVHTSDTPNKLSTIQFPFFSSLSENLNSKQCQHTQVIKWSVIRQSRDQVSGGYQPSGEGWHHSGFTLTPVSCPSFLPSVRGGQRKGFLPAFFQVCPSGSSIEGSSGCCCAPAALSTTVLGLKSFWSIRWSQM